MITVEVVTFTIKDDLSVLLVEPPDPAILGDWALPGAALESAQSLEASAGRTLLQHTGLSDAYLEQLYTFGDPPRDPRGRMVSVTYLALLAPTQVEDPPRRGTWHSMFDLPQLILDHADILAYGLARLRNKLEYTSAGFRLLPDEFTFPELQRLYEIILQRRLDKRNFRKRVLNLNVLEPTGALRPSTSRPARLYRFVEERFFPLKEKGILFPLH